MNFGLLLAAVSPAAKTVPGTYITLNKYHTSQ